MKYKFTKKIENRRTGRYKYKEFVMSDTNQALQFMRNEIPFLEKYPEKIERRIKGIREFIPKYDEYIEKGIEEIVIPNEKIDNRTGTYKSYELDTLSEIFMAHRVDLKTNLAHFELSTINKSRLYEVLKRNEERLDKSKFLYSIEDPIELYNAINTICPFYGDLKIETEE